MLKPTTKADEVYRLDAKFNQKLDNVKLKDAKKVLDKGKQMLRQRGQHSALKISRMSLDDPSFSVQFTKSELERLIMYIDNL